MFVTFASVVTLVTLASLVTFASVVSGMRKGGHVSPCGVLCEGAGGISGLTFPHNASLTSHGRVLDIDFCLFLSLKPISVKEVMNCKPPLCLPAPPRPFHTRRPTSLLRTRHYIYTPHP